jgi:hypothetical protein
VLHSMIFSMRTYLGYIYDLERFHQKGHEVMHYEQSRGTKDDWRNRFGLIFCANAAPMEGVG